MGKNGCFRTVNMILPEIFFGLGAIEKLSPILEIQNSKNVLIISDKGLKSVGIVENIEKKIKESVDAVHIFDKVNNDPDIENARRCIEFANGNELDTVIGIGGGSPMDIAKVVAALYRGEKDISAFFGHHKIAKKGLFTILVPTTAGTGTEMSIGAVISDKHERLKKGILSRHLLCNAAILDPELTVSCPPFITATAGLDAFTHAIEVFTNAISVSFIEKIAIDAIETIWEYLPIAYTSGNNLNARGELLEASMFAGIGMQVINNAAVHAMGAPLGAFYEIPHGLVNSFLLPYVMEFNRKSCVLKYDKIARRIGVAQSTDEEENSYTLIEKIRDFVRSFNINKYLAEINIDKNTIPEMAELSLRVWLMANNPSKMEKRDAIALYEKAFIQEGIKIM